MVPPSTLMLSPVTNAAFWVEHRVDDVRNFTHSTQGMKLRQRGMIILACIGVLVTPGDTVLNRNLFAAYPKRQPASGSYFQGRRNCNPMIQSHVVENQQTRSDVTGMP